MAEIAPYWNHNVHYQRLIMDAIPFGCGTALDVGCGDGLLAVRLAEYCQEVTGIDRDAPMAALAGIRARAMPAGAPAFIFADFMAHPFPPCGFDFVCANTALHHMDFAAALSKMARLLRPGGVLAVVGLAANRSLADWAVSALGVPVDLYYRTTRRVGGPGAPIKAPDMTWAQARDTARWVLPGVRYRRHLLWRYSLLWRKPG